jgi:hypothetical protein
VAEDLLRRKGADMGPSLGFLRQQAMKRMRILQFDQHPPSAKYEKYLLAINNETLMERWHKGLRPSDTSPDCQFWGGPSELFVNLDQVDVRYDPHKILLQLVAGSDVRPERVTATCSQKKCFNSTHYSVLTLGELNDANFESQMAIGVDESECVKWLGSKNFTVLHNWSSRSIEPQKYLFSRLYQDWRLEPLAFMTCSNPSCVNPAHVDRRPTPEETSERRTAELLESVFAIIDRPGLSKDMELGCVELTDEDLSELAGLVRPGEGYYRQIRASESDWIFRVTWHCLAATCWANYRFFALPRAFRNLGEVSSSVRKGFECPKSARCYTPSHRRDHLQKALKNTSNPRYRNSFNENVLKHSIGLTEDTLFQLLAT